MSDPLFSVEEQIVLVSGGTRGIGRAIAQGFAQRGARVVITGREKAAVAKSASELTQGKNIVRGFACDVSRAAEITRLVNDVEKEFGRIDTLINVAGVNRRKPTLEVTEEDYDFILDM